MLLEKELHKPQPGASVTLHGKELTAIVDGGEHVCPFISHHVLTHAHSSPIRISVVGVLRAA